MGFLSFRRRLTLEVPSHNLIGAYVSALSRGWSPDDTRDVSREHRDAIRRDADAFLRALMNPHPPRERADGTQDPGLVSVVRWIWRGTFVGTISLRYRPGTDELPPEISGHVGYSVVPWMRNQGHATRAVSMILPYARAAGMSRVMITCDATNIASKRVIEKSGGSAIEDGPPDRPGGPPKLRFWIRT